jgi:hypothetical protein
MQKTNKVVRVSFSGGLLGLIFGSARGKLEEVIQEHNKQGWNLRVSDLLCNWDLVHAFCEKQGRRR